jgi:hypothetical protein
VLETFTAETFKPLLHERFALVDGDSRVDLELVEVTESAAPGAERRTQFSIVFSGPADPILPQAIYRLEHPELGAFELFLVPIAAGSYEAVFT